MRTDPVRLRAFRCGLRIDQRHAQGGQYRLGGIWRTAAEAHAYLDGWIARGKADRTREREAL